MGYFNVKTLFFSFSPCFFPLFFFTVLDDFDGILREFGHFYGIRGSPTAKYIYLALKIKCGFHFPL